MRISDWSSDVCSSDLPDCLAALVGALAPYDIEPLGRLDEIEGPIFEDCDVGGSGRFVCLADGDDMHPGRARGRDAGRRIFPGEAIAGRDPEPRRRPPEAVRPRLALRHLPRAADAPRPGPPPRGVGENLGWGQRG